MTYLTWALRALWFPFYAAGEITKTSFEVMWDIVTPGSSSTPAFVEVPLRASSDFEVTMLANLISLTPGTVTVAVRKEPSTLWVHGLYVEDRESFQQGIRAMEDRLLAVTRPAGSTQDALDEVGQR
jgi:multicomponent Na+:H+ antiporter subunit E